MSRVSKAEKAFFKAATRRTNADRITSNVESLAKFIVEIADCTECEKMHGVRMCDAATAKACEDCWIGWLLQEDGA